MGIIALYLTAISVLIKIILLIIFIYLNYQSFAQQYSIIGFYLNYPKSKSYIFRRNLPAIKVKFFAIEYYCGLFIIIRFKNKLKNFRVVVFCNQIDFNLFKTLIIFAKYNFFPRNTYHYPSKNA